jgi:flagellar assembly factor FliW
MRIKTTRFGPIEVSSEEVLHFPAGLVGLESCRDWVLLADAQNDLLGWLQSTEREDVALAVVNPRHYVPDYQVRVYRREIAGLALSDPNEAQVLVVVSRNESAVTVNLKAPLLINLERKVGRQVIHNGDESLAHEVVAVPIALRRSA